MKKILFIAILSCLALWAKQESYSTNYVNYVIGKIDTNITHRTYAGLSEIFYDQDSTVWLTGDFDVCRMRKGETEFKRILDSNSKFFGPMNGFDGLYLDSYGKLICPRKKHFLVIDTKTDDVKMYPFKFISTVQRSLGNSLIIAGGRMVGNKMYLRTNLVDNIFLYLQYDENKKKWISDTNYIVHFPNNIYTSVELSYVIGDSLYLSILEDTERRKLILNTKTNEYSFGQYTIFDSLRNIEGYQKNLGLVENTKNNIFTYARVINKRAYIIRLDRNTDSLTFFKMPYVLHPSVEEAEDNFVQFLFPGGISPTAVDDNMDRFVFDYARHLYYWSEQEGFKYIPPPKHEDFDSTDWWEKGILFKYSDKEWWISGGMRYIYRIDIEKMLASRNENFPYKNYNSVEEQETEVRFKTIGILDILPNPCKSFCEFNYFLLPGFDRLAIDIYDVSGKKYDYKDYEILSEDNIFRKVRVNLNGDMPPGVYILQITENGNTYSKKFVVK